MAHDSFSLYSTVDANGNKIGIQIEEMYQFFGIGPGVTNGWYDETGGINHLLNNGYINMWARNKPEAIGDYRDLTDAQRRNNNFGLTAPTGYITLAKYVEAVNNGTLGSWEYNKPQIGIHWFRITDLDGYNKNAVSPFAVVLSGDYIKEGSGALRIMLGSSLSSQGTTGGLSKSDFTRYGYEYANWYDGVLLKKESAYYACTRASNSLYASFEAKDGNTAYIPPAGTYDAYAFMCNKEFIASHAVGSAAGMEIIPTTKVKATVTILSSAESLVVTGAPIGINFDVTVTNKNASAVVITPVMIQSSSNGTDATATTHMTFGSGDAFTVPAGSSTNPSIVTKSLNARIPMLMSGTRYYRLVYKRRIGNATESSNLFTPWMAQLSMGI